MPITDGAGMKPDRPDDTDKEPKTSSVIGLQMVRATCASFVAYLIALAVGGGIRPEATTYYGLAASVFLVVGLRLNRHDRKATVAYVTGLVGLSCFFVSILLLV
jgi:hypothetical protein